MDNNVASHYNEINEIGLEERLKSRIFYQRNFNNWIKSIVIGDTLRTIRKERKSHSGISVLDLGAGKGGDLLKWKKGNIDHITCVDIANISVEQCETRYKEMVRRSQNERHNKTFTADFIVADCTQDLVINKCKDGKDRLFDITSCQFCLHYSFESKIKAETFLNNACANLKPGGFFIGTTTDSAEMIHQLRKSEGMSFGNEVYKITFEIDDKENIPLFGAKYNFFLEGVVNCPEYLVYFPLLIKMLEKHKMKLVYKESFGKFYKSHSQRFENISLLKRMQALEPYPNDADIPLMSADANAYTHAKDYIAKLSQQHNSQQSKKIGTLSTPEWQSSSLYLVFAFQKTDS